MAQAAGPAGGAPHQAMAGHQHANRGAVEREILAKMNLSNTQKSRLKELIAKHTEEAKALRAEAKTSTDKSALREKHKAMRQEYLKAISGILTPAQLEQYKALHKEYFQKLHGKQNGKNPPPVR